jgi:hypothetical protein
MTKSLDILRVESAGKRDRYHAMRDRYLIFNIPWDRPIVLKYGRLEWGWSLAELMALARVRVSERIKWDRDARAAMERRATFNTAWEN